MPIIALRKMKYNNHLGKMQDNHCHKHAIRVRWKIIIILEKGKIWIALEYLKQMLYNVVYSMCINIVIKKNILYFHNTLIHYTYMFGIYS